MTNMLLLTNPNRLQCMPLDIYKNDSFCVVGMLPVCLLLNLLTTAWWVSVTQVLFGRGRPRAHPQPNKCQTHFGLGHFIIFAPQKHVILRMLKAAYV